jgi:hypothetical protein
MSEPQPYPLQIQLSSSSQITAYALLPSPQPPPRQPAPLPGSLCEQCLDAPATQLQPAPWGGDMGVCEECAGKPPGEQVQPAGIDVESRERTCLISEQTLLRGIALHLEAPGVPRSFREMIAMPALRLSRCETMLDDRIQTPHGQPCACGQVRFVYQPDA